MLDFYSTLALIPHKLVYPLEPPLNSWEVFNCLSHPYQIFSSNMDFGLIGFLQQKPHVNEHGL
jgi:hypothetical protein